METIDQTTSGEESKQNALLVLIQSVQQMAVESDFQRVLWVCCEQLKRVGLPIQAVGFNCLVDKTQKIFEKRRLKDGEIFSFQRMANDEMFERWQSGSVHIVNDVSQQPDAWTDRLRHDFGNEPICALIDVPFSAGVLSIYSNASGVFASVDKVFLVQVAEILGLGLARLHDFAKFQQAENELDRSQDKMQAALEHLPDGVSMLDRNLHLALTNPRAESHLTTLLGQAPHSEALTELGDHNIEDILTGNGSILHEVKADGCIFEISAAPVVKGSAVDGWVMVTRDVTELREDQTRIQESYRLASLGQLSAGISHDFNNLLTVIMGFAQMLEFREDLPEDVRKDLRLIYAQGQRAAQLIRQILDFARQNTPDRQTTDLVPFVREITKLLQRTLPETIQFDVVIEDTSAIADINLTQMQQVLTNLAVNARDAMPNGGSLCVEISCFSGLPIDEDDAPAELAPGEWAKVKISDTGTGIPKEVLGHIFEPFFTTKTPDKGTGLGLAQSYGIVKEHGGHIDVQTQVGQGTTFTVYLPIVPRQNNPEAAIGELDLIMGAGQMILLVEDEPGVRQVAKCMLEGLNYKVMEAENGTQAKEVYAQHSHDIQLVLTDMVMPEMSGRELIQTLRQETPSLKAVVMSGYPLNEPDSEQFMGEIEGWVDKPVSLEKISDMVGTAFNK